ncbi:MAG TPA: neuraminidase-like domain-containing protein [Thermoanaerobaculia bacterium]|nr:neuraminidase-like domain-containing protein [Thermoanaerobaculia bacterium]
MLELLGTYFVNPGRAIRIVSTDPENPDTCETEKLVLDGFDQEAAARTVRFVRLARALGWSARDLDRAVTAFAADLDDDFLVRLSHVRRLHDALDVPVPRLLAWWSDLDTAFYLDHGASGQPRAASVYDQLFRNRAAVNPLDPAFTEDPADLTGTLSAHSGAITAALRLSAADFARLLADPNVVPQDAALTLENLSLLYRHASLARALRLSVREYLAALSILDSTPFTTTTDTLLFVETVARVRAAGFTFAELSYLLRHVSTPDVPVAPRDETIAAFLDELRTGLQAIEAENTFRTDPTDPAGPTVDLDGTLTRQKLALLNWDPALIDQVIATLTGALVYEAPLTELPDGAEDLLQRLATYDAGRGILSCTGPLTNAQKDLLNAASNNAAYQGAVGSLYGAPRAFVLRTLRGFSVHDFVTPLAALPAGLAIPKAFRRKIFFEPKAGRLHCLGVMSDAENSALLALSADSTWQAAVADLWNQAGNFIPAASDTFLIPADISALFDTATAPGDRFLLVLAKLLPALRRILGEQLAVQKTVAALQLEARAADALLRTWLTSPVDPARRCLDELLDPDFADSNPNVQITPAAFPRQYKIFLRLHKAALVAVRFKLTARQLGWLFTYGPAAGWLDLNALPTAAEEPAAGIDGWLRLADLVRLRSGLPQGEKALDELLAAATKAAWFDAALRWTRWEQDDLEVLLGAADDPTDKGLFDAAFPAGYVGEKLLLRLRESFGLLTRLGMSAQQAADLTAATVSQSVARGVRQAVRARYDEAQWLNLAKPLQDVLREKQRAALVAWLVAHLNLPGLQDSNDLYAWFLIDVEMDPCMMTSRIKQALSSVQLFVQRCLMSLEPEVAASAEVDVRWREWKWMKNYRVWEANRKVFLYPENWIEPELRDDKSPFFVELEGALLQSDLTMDSAEDALLHYLENLDQVARLEVVAIYHQVEEDSVGQAAVDILHVFARTTGTPHVYFYRRRVDSAFWTAWERLDLDIEGEHLVPVVWNRRLYLFWPVFTEKPKPLNVQVSGGTMSGNNPVVDWEIKLAWSERKQGQWTNKRVSTESCHIEKGPFTNSTSDFFFRTVIGPENNALYVSALYGSMIETYYYSWTNTFRFDGCRAEPATDLLYVFVEEITGTGFDRMFRREDGEQQLYLPAPTDTAALQKTPGTFRLLPYADGISLSSHPFFFADDKRTFFVIPSEVRVQVWVAADPGNLEIPGIVWDEVQILPDPIGPIVDPEDPWMFDPSFAVSDVGVSFGGAQAGGIGGIGGIGGQMQKTLGVAEAAAAPEAMELGGGSEISKSMTLPGTIEWASELLSKEPAAGLGNGWYEYRTESRFRFQTFYHPWLCSFVRELNRDGVDGLLQRRLQIHPEDFALRTPSGQAVAPLDFKAVYEPHKVSHPVVTEPYPLEDVDFLEDGAYALYNWELFFHVPLLIADRLSKNQRYEDAQSWFHYVFDPTDTSSLDVPQRYWHTRPFFERTKEGYQRERIQYIIRLLAEGSNPQTQDQLSPEEQEDLARFDKAVSAWRKDPFMPHLIARLRTTAYQKTVVMKYLDNLIAWGDQLFRRDTIESINEATQLYVLAAEILGRRPDEVPPRATPRVETYNSLAPQLDSFSNALVQIEDFVSPSAGDEAVVDPGQPSPSLPLMLYFCIPKNDKLLSYWDTVADRLFKIRHCMNIEGIVRQLPLFEPPIDPALLVKAAAAGVDFGSVLNDVSAALPHYRFQTLAQKATELCGDLKSLGQGMLSALEKRDAEHLGLLRATHEADLLARAEEVKKLQIDEAEQNRKALIKSRETAASRYTHYQKLLGVQSPQVPDVGQPLPEGSPSQHIAIQDEGGVKMIPHEQEEMDRLAQADSGQSTASDFELGANIAHLIPNIKGAPFGVGGEYGGQFVGFALGAFANRFRSDSAHASYEAGRAAKLGQYALRAHDWLLQSNLAAREIMQIDQQILAADLRIEIAGKELANHRRQIDNAREVEDVLRDKYTNEELYGWMIGQLATVYFQSYQLAYDLAKRAERSFRHELSLKDSSFIQFGYWDSLKKGLLAGERLFLDLKRMEAAYLDQHRREYEITRHVSVSQLDPLALIQLRQTGSCIVRLPEALFDLDFPGHYMRRIKSVGVSIPCVTGPYTGVPCTLTLLKSSVRHGNTLLGGKHGRQEGDPRFTDSLGSIQSIVTSSARDDRGLFESNLHDERFLPFEGAGVISEWQIELPAEFRQFDYDTIADVILHAGYTAREGGGSLKQQAVNELKIALDAFVRSEGEQGLAQIVSLRHEMPTEWYRFLNPPADAPGVQALPLALSKERFPFLFAQRPITITAIELFLRVRDGFEETHNETTLQLTLAPGLTAPTPADVAADATLLLTLAPWNGLLRTSRDYADGPPPGPWTLNAWLPGDDEETVRLDPEALQDLVVIVRYSVA